MKTLKTVSLVLLGVLTAVAFSVGLGSFAVLRQASGVSTAALAGGFTALYLYAVNRGKPFGGDFFFASLVAVFFLFGDACRTSLALSPLWKKPFQAVGLLLVYFCFALAAARTLHALLNRDFAAFPQIKHPFLFFALLLLIAWLPQLILKFPGTLCYDNVTQLAEAFGYTPMKSDHPLPHTLLLGLFFRFGRLFGSSNLGLFLFVAVQAVFMAGVFAFTLVQMDRYRVPRFVVLCALFVYAVSPNVTGYLSIPLKDIPYSTLYVLYTSMLLEFVLDAERFWQTKRYVAALVLSGAGIVLLRLNGLLCILPLSAVLVIRLLRGKEKPRVKTARVAAVLMTFVLTLTVNTTLNLVYRPTGGSMGEPLTFFFQQTARTMRDHPDDVSEKDREVIDRVLDADQIAALYHPDNGDAVKNTYKQSATVSDLARYLGVWAKGLVTHPVTYLEATVSQNYTLFYPQQNNIKYYPSVRTHHPLDGEMKETKALHNLFPKLLDGVNDYYTCLHCLPALGLLSNIGFMVLLLLALLAFSRAEKLRGFRLVALPSLITLVMCLFSPVIYLQSRYAFPLVYAMPIVTAAYWILRKNSIHNA